MFEVCGEVFDKLVEWIQYEEMMAGQGEARREQLTSMRLSKAEPRRKTLREAFSHPVSLPLGLSHRITRLRQPSRHASFNAIPLFLSHASIGFSALTMLITRIHASTESRDDERKQIQLQQLRGQTKRKRVTKPTINDYNSKEVGMNDVHKDRVIGRLRGKEGYQSMLAMLIEERGVAGASPSESAVSSLTTLSAIDLTCKCEERATVLDGGLLS